MRYCSVKNCVNNDVSFVIFIHQKWDFWVKLNLCRKVPGKKVSGKKQLEIKTLEKKSEFYQVLGKIVSGNKVRCFGFLGLFFLK